MIMTWLPGRWWWWTEDDYDYNQDDYHDERKEEDEEEEGEEEKEKWRNEKTEALTHKVTKNAKNGINITSLRRLWVTKHSGNETKQESTDEEHT